MRLSELHRRLVIGDFRTGLSPCGVFRHGSGGCENEFGVGAFNPLDDVGKIFFVRFKVRLQGMGGSDEFSPSERMNRVVFDSCRPYIKMDEIPLNLAQPCVDSFISTCAAWQFSFGL
jgi:hypothetical protein